MHEHTLTVPAEHAEHFRAAMVEEIAFDTRMLQGERENAPRRAANELAAKSNAADLRSMTDQLICDAGLLEQMGDDGPIEFRTADVGGLAHVCEQMAQKVIAPQLARRLDYVPLDGEALAELRPLLAALAWVLDRAAELHDADQRERANRKAA
ncbi:MAG: hypothetical protein ACR2LH_10800 [Thermoleophilaceae bacterium]